MGKHANLGYFFQRDYYKGINKYILDDESQAEKYFSQQNTDLIESSKIKIDFDDSLKKITDKPITLQTIYPGLVTGIGMMHETGMLGESKLGMAFDYTTGLPYIPGSSVKGLLRSMFPLSTKNSADKNSERILEEKKKFIKNELMTINNNKFSTLSDEDIVELSKQIFEGLKNNSYIPIYNRDVFFDAHIIGDYSKSGFLSMDYITPHKNELQDPNPIQFLKIRPNVKFAFCFRLGPSLLPSGIEVSICDKKALFETILTTVGIGAKTNVGYGQLKKV